MQLMTSNPALVESVPATRTKTNSNTQMRVNRELGP